MKTEINDRIPKMAEQSFNLQNHDRYALPDFIEKVTAGNGGESFLIFGSRKTAIYDCGMAYCHENLLKNIERALEKHGRKSVDLMLISHSHFDHIGALPYVRAAYPEMQIFAAQKCKDVFERPNALALIKKLGEEARENYGSEREKAQEISAEGMKVDIAVKQSDRIYIGEEYFEVLNTPGHTDCSLAYILQPTNIMFVCESTGVLKPNCMMHTAAVKSPRQCIESALRCKAYGAKQLISQHYGILPPELTESYFDAYVKMAEDEAAVITAMNREGCSQEEIIAAYTAAYWNEGRTCVQPRGAFEINAGNVIRKTIEENL